jgi:DNA-binding PadR family transcriptional regulator
LPPVAAAARTTGLDADHPSVDTLIRVFGIEHFEGGGMARRRFTNLLALAVLSCLNERPMHPYEISQTLRHRGKDQSIRLNYGALYSVVDSLAKAGLIEPLETTREGRRPERTVYAITDAGRDEHDQWLSELIATPVREYHSLETALALVLGLGPDQAVRLLETRVVGLKAELGRTDALLAATREMGLAEIFTVEEDFRRAMLVAELAYVEKLVTALREDRLTGMSGWRKVHRLLAKGMTFEEIMRDPVKHLGKEAAMFAGGQPQ